MGLLMDNKLSARSRTILEAIIEDYISTGEPVGSSAIARRHSMPISSATIRNVMAQLEEQGLLSSPHTSAGRIPTDKAYRFYVDSLVNLRQVSREEKKQIINRCRATGVSLADILKEASSTVSSISNYLGLVIAPSFTADIFRHIEFLRLGNHKILAILVSQNGMVQNRLVTSDRDFNESELVSMGNYLNELMCGLTISQAHQRILEEMQSEKVLYDTLLSQALIMSQQAVADDSVELFLEGQSRILEQPEFSDVNRMKDIYQAFEQKSHLLQLLSSCMNSDGVHIFIGAETPVSSSAGISMITSRFVTANNTVGLLGVIGPTRMGYSSVIPIVDYTAKLVGKLLQTH